MITNQAELTGRHFLRVSKDESGRERSNEEQQTDNEQVWGFRFVGTPYREVASASRYAKKERDEFPKLLADLRAGRFGADVLVMWEGSRGSRKVSEWAALIDECETVGVFIAVTEHERIYNPGNARDRKELIDNANDAEYESAKISARTKRSARSTAASGRSIGRVNYGYRRIYDPETREFLRQEPDPTEAPVVTLIYDRLIAGHSLRSIAQHLNNQAVTTRYGARWHTATVRRIATNIAYTGKRSHLSLAEWRTLPVRERRRKQHQTVVQGWPAIIPDHRWHAVQRLLGDPSRASTGRPGRATYPFSQIIRCDPCGGPLAAINYLSVDGHYRCTTGGCVLIPRPGVDQILEAAILGYLSRPDVVSEMLAPERDDIVVESARNEAAGIRAELDELYDAVGSGQVSLMMSTRVEPVLLQRLEAAERHLADLTTPSVLRGLIEPGAEVAKRWKAAPVSAKRRVAKILLHPDVLGEVRVTPVRRDFQPVAAQERLVWRTTD